jgi:hypothetical protein
MSIAALWFSFVIATIPGEWQETALAALDRPRWQIYPYRDVELTKRVSTHDFLFAGAVNPSTRRRDSLFSNTLVLPAFNLFEALKIDDPKKLAWKEHLLIFARAIWSKPCSKAPISPRPIYMARICSARRSITRSFRARRSMARSCRAHRSISRSCRARLSNGRSFRGRRSVGSFRARRSIGRSFRARRSVGSFGRVVPLGAASGRVAQWAVLMPNHFGGPISWDAQAYNELRHSMNSIPEDGRREVR